MVLIYASAVESVRRPYFETFWYTHHLFIVWLALLIPHGAASQLEPTTLWAWIAGARIAHASSVIRPHCCVGYFFQRPQGVQVR